MSSAPLNKLHDFLQYQPSGDWNEFSEKKGIHHMKIRLFSLSKMFSNTLTPLINGWLKITFWMKAMWKFRLRTRNCFGFSCGVCQFVPVSYFESVFIVSVRDKSTTSNNKKNNCCIFLRFKIGSIHPLIVFNLSSRKRKLGKK